MPTIECRLCLRVFEKGGEPDPTQDDSTFVCGECGTAGYPQNGYRKQAQPLELPAKIVEVAAAPPPAKRGLLHKLRGLFGA